MRNRITENKPDRPTRVPLVEQRNKLTVQDKDPDYVYRWVNDTEDRINKFKLAGYEVVKKEEIASVGDPSVDTEITGPTSITEKAVGQRTKAILMKQRKEWYEEDQKSKQIDVDKAEAEIYRDAKSKSDYGNVVIDNRKKV